MGVCKRVLESLRVALLAIVRTFWIFCESSSLHGLRYIAGSGREGFLLRFVWSVFSLVGLGFTVTLGYSAWEQFRTNPTLTTIETTTFPVSMIPFPSVTLCNINKIHSAKAKELSQQLIDLGMSENDTVDLLGALPRLHDYRPVSDRVLELEQFLLSKGYDAERLAFEVAPPCETMMVDCFWLMQPVPCAKVFRRTKIFAGYCCSYNADQFLEPINTRAGDRDSSESLYVTGIGKGEGLSVLVDIGESYYTGPHRFTHGVKVFVHQSFDIPDASDYTAIVQRGVETDVSVLPVIISASPAMRAMPVERRGCAFDGEKTITTALRYTHSNCMNECEQRHWQRVCQCVPLFKQIVELQVLRVPVCGFRDLPCLLQEKEHTLFTSESENVTTPSLSVWKNVKCHCFPSCTIEKNEVLSISNSIAYTEGDMFAPGINFSAYGLLHVHFRSTNCLKYRREPFLTWQSLVATFGGIFGLCMGGSILSVLEMLYHCGITPFVVYGGLRRRLTNKAAPQAVVHISYLDFPGRVPIGYFRRNEVMARELQNARPGWWLAKDLHTVSKQWPKRYTDEFNLMA
ncbi:sodium channel protein Nach-like [Anopheles bellator]|uniref:sodium channel protein Nach-like n=1 Tax=Anopheles bellator TaxID=139047 RepID=UPI002648EC55|nr:sodium channel protein Nach-like [Anopheles bellator]